MFCGGFLKGFCIAVVVGCAAGVKIDASNVNSALLHKPDAMNVQGTPFWDASFCRDRDDFESFPHPNSCNEFLMCYNSELWEMTCPVGELYDAWRGVCDDARNVKCLDERCPPKGSNEVRFLPADQCDQFIRCFDGEPHLFTCPVGRHWNSNLGFCDEPRFAGCTVSYTSNKVFS